jgi:RNA recognition motif-containing protein
MSNDAEAQQAMRELDGSQLDGRTIKVNEARPPEKRF